MRLDQVEQLVKGLGSKYRKRDPSVDFYIDRITPCRIAGWAWRPKNSQERLTIELLRGTSVIAVTEASIFREDLKIAGKADGYCGFEMEIPRTARDQTGACLFLRAAGNIHPFHEIGILDRITTTDTDAFSDLEWNIENIGPESISGWIWNPTAPTRRIVVEILENDVVLSQGIADRYRGDLDAARKSDGRCSFDIALPGALLDGWPHSVTIRVSGDPNPFYVAEARTFARPSSDFDLVSPFSVVGSVWLANRSADTFAIEILLDGKTVHACETDALNGFAWTPDPACLAGLVGPSKQARTVSLTCLGNGSPILEKTFDIVATPGGELALHLEEVSVHRLAGRVLALTAGITRVKVYVGEALVADRACAPHCAFDIALGPLRLPSGHCEITVQPIAADGGTAAPFVQVLDYRRWWLDLDLVEDRVRGRVTDAWQCAGEIAVELLLDGVPVGVTTARPSPGDHEFGADFCFGLSNRWRDGRAHSVQVRIAGVDGLWPERPLLFQAGDEGATAVARAERLGDAIAGFALMPWAPDAVADVELLAGARVLDRQRADRQSPALSAEGMLPECRGFSFELPPDVAGPVAVRALHDGDPVWEQAVVSRAPSAFALQDAGFGHRGACFVLPDPFTTSIGREDARTVLFAAAAFARASSLPLSIVLAGDAGRPERLGVDLFPLVRDLVGEGNARDLAGASFLQLPDPVLPSTAAGGQHLAYALDLWVRACAFSLVLGPSRGGMLAYCGISRREGLLPDGTQIVILVDDLVVTDRIGRDLFLDDPALLVTEALERAAIVSADHLLGHGPACAATIETVAPNKVSHAEIEAADIGPLRPVPLQGGIDGGRHWLIFAGHLTARSGLVLFCDAIDRLARRPCVDPDKLGILFIGNEDWVRGRLSGKYIRDRTRKWPFALRLCLDLTFDSAASVMADYAAVGQGVVLPALAGTPWQALLAATQVPPVVIDGPRPDNATDLADALQRALAETAEWQAGAPATESRLGTILAEVAAKGGAAATATDDTALPSVTVCITHFNRPTLLRQTLASLRANAYPALDVVIVDDGSAAAGVAEALAEIAVEYTDIGVRIFPQSNAYLGAARNAAARRAKGEFIVFMDDDNLAHPGMLRGFIAAQRATQADIVTSRFGYFDGTDNIDPGKDVPRRLGIPLMPDLAVGVFANCFGDANMLIRRSAFERLGGFTEDFGRGHEDWEFFARAHMAGLTHILSNRVLFWYREDAQSMLLGRESESADHLRNIRAYAAHLPPEIYRIVMLAQGLIRRWDRPPAELHKPARPGLEVARRLAYGRVAVVMRTKDRAILLERAIDSVLQQTYADWALVVVNDGGDPQPVRDLLDSRKDRLQGRSLLIDNPTSTGMENASNAGVTASASEFIAIHDDDDAWAPNFLERCVATLDLGPPEVAGVVTQSTVVIEDIEGERVVERHRFPFASIGSVEIARLAVENQFPPISFLFRRSALETVGSFDGTLPVLGDWDFHLRLAERFPIAVLQEALAFYHHRTAGVTNQYGNTVVAQKEVHRRYRSEYINRHLRRAMSPSAEGYRGTMLMAGEMHRIVTKKLDEMHEHLHWLEKLSIDGREHMRYLEKLIDDRLK